MLSSISALDQVYRWCAAQPLHSITAGIYARIAKDSHLTKIYKISDRHWRIVNEGHQRTFRIPADLGYPDIKRSKGVTGYKDEGEWRYIHTSGLPVTEIVLSQQAQRHLHLISSTAEISFEAASPDEASFEAEDLRAIHVVLGGAPPESICNITINGNLRKIPADAKGQISIKLPTSVIATVSTDDGDRDKKTQQASN